MNIQRKFYLYFFLATTLPLLIIFVWSYNAYLSVLALALFIVLFLFVQRDFLAPLNSVWQWLNNYKQHNNYEQTHSNSFSQVANAIDHLTRENQSLYDDMEAVLNHQVKRLSKKTASLEILYNMSEQINKAGNKEELFRSFLHTFVQMSGATGGVAREVVTTDDGKAELCTVATYHDKVIDNIVALDAPCLQANGVQFSVYHCPSCVHNKGHIGTIFIPLVYKERRLGAFGLFFDAEPSLAYDERMLLQTISDNVASYLDKLNQIEEHNQHEIFKQRLYLSQDIHDSLAQTIYSMNLQVSLLKDMTADEKLLRGIGKVEDSIVQANRDIRVLIDSFRGNSVTYTNKIKEIIQRFSEEVEIKIYSQINDVTNAEVQKQLSMIISEALTNIKKHAQAKNVRIVLGSGQLLIEDDGVGFDMSDNQDAYHVGMQVMRERAERIGATFYAESEVGSGTIIVVNYEL